ncbi:MAG: PD40 domain-containing protein [Gammaproteobacteria bacterium]|nr:PD40 domain-containing protein [Gammaproteobacteria bacterium]
MRTLVRNILAVALALCLATPLVAQQTVTRGGNLAADIAFDGRVAIDLEGDIWIVPPGGGEARPVTDNLRSAQRPRWSPNARQIAYQAVLQGKSGLFIHDLESGQTKRIGGELSFDMRPAWHPRGERLVYASDTNGMGFDLWEIDLPSGLRWRLTDRQGDETDPAWSADGRDLVYVHQTGDQSHLILRRHGLPEETLLTTTDKILGPSWRPDGSLITFVRHGETQASIDMVILAEPRLVRQYANNEAFGQAPVSWLDRHRMLYTADGMLRQRLFNSWVSSPLPFEATLQPDKPATAAKPIKRRPLARIDEPPGRLVIRAARLYDGIGGGYQFDRDVLISGGRIEAVEPRDERPGSVVIDMGDVVVLPGYVDAYGRLQELTGRFGDTAGPAVLTTGVTTIVAAHNDSKRLNELWSGKSMPGPRLLSRDDWPLTNLLSIADSTTPGLAALLQSRQSLLSQFTTPPARRFSSPLTLAGNASSAVVSSFQNGLPAGIGLHAEFLALIAAELQPEQALRAAGVNAAAALKLDPLLGRIAVGAAADLVLVDGDPLANIADALKIVAVVRNGRFFSVSGLIDRVQLRKTVE